MNKFGRLSVIVLAAVFFIVGCGESEQAKQERELKEAAKQMEEAGKKMAENLGTAGKDLGDAMEQMSKALYGGEGGGEPVDFRKLKDMLPESLPGMKRVSATGEKQEFGFKVSFAEAKYQAEDGEGRMEIKITDIGSMAGIAAMANYAWATAEFDRETESGYERTVTFEGYHAVEKYDNRSKHAELDIMLADRFVVEASGYDVPMEKVKSAVKVLELDKLAAHKEQSAE